MLRVATFSHHQTLIQYMMRSQAEVATAQIRAASSKASPDYAGVGADTGQLLTFEATLARSAAYVDAGEIVSGRIETMYSALGSIAERLANLKSAITGLQSGTGEPVATIQTEAEGLLEEVASLLNTQQGERYLFSGSLADTMPVTIDAASYPAAAIPSTVDTSYYQGDAAIARLQAADDLVISYGVTADEPALEMALRALNLIARSDPDALDEDLLNEAYALADDAITGVATLQVRLSTDANTLDRAMDRHTDEQLVLSSLVSDLGGIDLAEETARLAALEAALEATMQVLTVLEKHHLHDLL